jgi:FixJ family two-component response regulator
MSAVLQIMDKSSFTVFVVDDDPSVRRSMTRLLQSAGYAVETMATADDYLRQSRHRGPGCLLLDIQMPGLNGLDLQKALATADREIPIIFISGHADIPDSVQAMKGGAVDFLTKPLDQDDLLAAIDRAIEKDRSLRKLRSHQKIAGRRFALLTSREHDVFEQVVQGRLNKQIAFKLGISEKTVKVHRARVMEKLRVGSVAELVRFSEKTNAVNTLDQSQIGGNVRDQ